MKRVKFFLQALSSFPSRILAFSRKPLGRSLPKAKANSIKFQISILYTSILGVILIVFSGVLYIILSHSLYVEPDYKLKQKAQEISQTIRTYLDIRGGVPGALEFAATKTIAPETVKLSRWWMGGFERRWFKRLDKLDLRRDFINFASFDEVSIIHSKTLTDDMLELFEAHIRFPSDGESILKSITYNKKKLRLINYPFVTKDGHKYIIQVGIAPNPTVLLLQNWLRSIVVSIPVVLLLTSFVGQMFAKRILAPLNEITATAQKITHEDLSSRVPAKQFGVEMDGVIEAFNDMIDRLEKSFKHIENFSSQVAHELKTPLSIIRGESELALRRERDPREYKNAIKVNLEESERMLKTIDDLLLLTKLDYQHKVFRFEDIDFTEFFKEIYGQTQILATKKKIRAKLNIPEGPIMIHADKLHLRRLFFNLIDNALKITPAGRNVYLLAKCEGLKLRVSIVDAGPGIAEADIPKIFEKFFRLDMREPGTGLGLNIALSIAKLHKGNINVSSKVGEGSTFLVTLPVLS